MNNLKSGVAGKSDAVSKIQRERDNSISLKSKGDGGNIVNGCGMGVEVERVRERETEREREGGKRRREVLTRSAHQIRLEVDTVWQTCKYARQAPKKDATKTDFVVMSSIESRAGDMIYTKKLQYFQAISQYVIYCIS